MANVNDSEIHLGLALESLRNLSSTGAGANASIRSRGPLTELVWSKQNGLSIKCFADKKPCRLTDFGPTEMGVPPCQGTKVEKRASDDHLGGSQASCHVGLTSLLGSTDLGQTDEAGEGKCVQFIEMKHCDKSKEECLGSSKSIRIGNSEGQKNQTTADLLPLLANDPEILQGKSENICDGTHRLGLDIGFPLVIQDSQKHFKRDEDDSKEDGSSSAPFIEKIEETAENDVLDLVEKDVIMENQEGNCRDDLVRGEESFREEDGNHGSTESCNSANLLSKMNKRRGFEHRLFLGSKRIKKQSEECVVKHNSSFMNWISNMMKGVKPSQEEDHSLALSVGRPIDDDPKIGVCDKSLNLGSKRLGFQTVFQSLYSQDVKPLKTIENKSIDSSNEVVLANETGSDHTPDDHLNQNASGSLWITRLSPKPPSKYSSFDDASASFDLKKLGENEFKKHKALPSSETFKTHLTTSCFFCGKTGHGLRSCLEINEKERTGLLKNVSLYEGVAKEAPCFCIKCLQLNHWASVCRSKRCFSMIENEESPSDLNLKPKGNEKVFPGKKVSNPNEIPKQLSSSSGNRKVSNKETILGAPEEMFETIRRLRLSRTDILKWMNSRFPIANLDGFFLRLRLAKWEEGVGEAGYYVACITGSQGGNPLKGSKKPIRVNVGGVECLVESRYVSNCDFLENELVAWWQKTSINEQIPMKENLNSMLDERKKLGF